MIKKEIFVEAINTIERQVKLDRTNSKFLGKIFPNAYSENLIYDNSLLINVLIDVLCETMEDKKEYFDDIRWIEYFIYELNFGKDNDRLKVYDKNNKEIPMGTPEELYDFLLKDNKNK